MKLKKEKGRNFKWEGLNGYAYNESTDSPNVTAAVIETTTSHGKTKNKMSDIVYYIVNGNGEFFVNNSWISVEKDDVIIIPKNMSYDFRAINSTLKVFIVHTPGYSPADDEKVA